jgi:hypothetical protein
MANMRIKIKSFVFVALFLSVAMTLATGLLLEEGTEGSGGGEGASVLQGEGGVGLHAVMAGSIVLFLLIHIFLNRQVLLFTLKQLFGTNGKGMT